MSQPTLDQIAPGGSVNLSGAPAPLDDATFDSMFPPDGTTQVTAPAQPTAHPQGTPAAPTQPAPTTAPTQQSTTQAQPSAPFLKGDKSVYNSVEAAIEGINQKDVLIEQLRTRYALTTGIDPITGQPIGQVQQQQTVDYTQNRAKYIEDLYAATKQGGEAYASVQEKFVLDLLKPLQPVMQKVVREQAVEEASKEVKDLGTFMTTPVYQKALDANPELKHAIAAAESDARFHSRLPGLYKLAYLSGQGLQLPELLKANAAAQTQQNNPTPVRATAQPTTQAPPRSSASPTLNTIDGIKAIIANAEASGMKLDW